MGCLSYAMLLDLTPEERNAPITRHEDVCRIFHRLLMYEDEAGREREHLWVMGFQHSEYVKFVDLVALGQFNRVATVGRDIYRTAVSQGANRIILCHNHPGGSTRPSSGDLSFTARTRQAGELLGITLLHHFIITEKRWEAVDVGGLEGFF